MVANEKYKLRIALKLFLSWITELPKQNSKVLFSVFFRSTHRWWKSEEKQTTRNGANRVFIDGMVNRNITLVLTKRYVSFLGSLGSIKWLTNENLPFIVWYFNLCEKVTLLKYRSERDEIVYTHCGIYFMINEYM